MLLNEYCALKWNRGRKRPEKFSSSRCCALGGQSSEQWVRLRMLLLELPPFRHRREEWLRVSLSSPAYKRISGRLFLPVVKISNACIDSGHDETKVNMWEAPTQFAKWKTEHVSRFCTDENTNMDSKEDFVCEGGGLCVCNKNLQTNLSAI